MPGDGLALAIRIGCQQQHLGTDGGGGDFLDLLGATTFRIPGHGEIGIRADRAILGRQVADMAEACQYLVLSTQIFVDGFGLGGRLDDDDLHGPAFGIIYKDANKPSGPGAGIYRWSSDLGEQRNPVAGVTFQAAR